MNIAKRKNLIYQKALLFFGIVFLLLFSSISYADKTFPGNIPTNCSGSGSAYSCGSLTISEHYFFTGSGNITVTVSGSLTINNYTIGQWNDNANVTFVVNGNVTINSPTIHANINAGSNNITYNGVASTSGNLITTSGNISTRGVVYGNITTNSGTITVNANNTSVIWGEITVKNATSTNYLRINQDAVVNGSIYTNSTSTTANLNVDIAERATINGSIIALGRDYTYVNINYDAIVNGDVTAFGDDASIVRLYDRARINGNVKSTSVDNDNGDVDLNANARITGNITAFGDIDNYGQINGCANSTFISGGDIRLRSGSSNSGGSCCGSNRTSCNSNCVDNDSSFATTLCQSTEAIVVNAYGESANGVWPIMELWVNQVKVDTVVVNSSTAKNYTFYANLPAAAGFKLDLVFPNDAWQPPEDRNLIINSINYRGKTILSTDASVIRDWGNNSSEYFDGIGTDAPNVMLHSNGAMRFNTADLIAYYALDETSWNGTSNETKPKDTANYSGGPFDGQGTGTSKPVAEFTNRARSGINGTCGYATFTGNTNAASFTLDGLPVSTVAGAKTSVSFWMYWNGNTSFLIPIGWRRYALTFGNTFFGFDTFNGDRYGVASNTISVGWHHYVAVFTNGDVTQNELYLDGTKLNISKVRPSNPIVGQAVVQSTLKIAGITDTAQNVSGFDGGRIDEVKIYNGAISQAQVTADYNAVHSCPAYATNATPHRFNCIAEQETNVNIGKLYTQLVATNFNIKVAALKTDGSAETTFSAASDRTAVLSFRNQVSNELIDFSGGETARSKNVLFTTANNTGFVTVNDISIPQAYRNLRCEVTEGTISASPSSDNFSVRPLSLTISTNVTSPYTAGNDFTLTADGGAGYNGTPKLLESRVSATPVKKTHMLTNTNNDYVYNTSNNIFLAVSSGQSTLALRYHDVGLIHFAAAAVLDGSLTTPRPAADVGFSFTEVDYSDTSTDCIARSASNVLSTGANPGKYGCNIASPAHNDVGRFRPNHFIATTNTLTAACSAGGFTYMSQPNLTLNTVIEAKSSQNITSKSYNTGTVGYSVRNNLTPITASRLQKDGSTWTPASAPSDWSNGTINFTETTLNYAKSDSEDGPYENFNINFTISDADKTPFIVSSASATNQTKMRFGRIALRNAYGSELLPISIPVEAQYWDSTTMTYRRNTLDDCTTLHKSDFDLDPNSYKKNLSAGEIEISGVGVMVAGKSKFTLSKPSEVNKGPGADNNGSVDLSFNLLNFPWLGSGTQPARATFGLYKSPIIYMRENF